MNQEEMQKSIADTCDEVKALLLEKNRSYGNAVAEPSNIFSKETPVNQARVRIDDKLKRIAMGHEYGNDDTRLDLIGYLVIEMILMREEGING